MQKTHEFKLKRGARRRSPTGGIINGDVYLPEDYSLNIQHCIYSSPGLTSFAGDQLSAKIHLSRCLVAQREIRKKHFSSACYNPSCRTRLHTHPGSQAPHFEKLGDRVSVL